MDILVALIIYIIVIIIVYLLARFYHVSVWSSFVLAFLFGLIVLSAIKPYSELYESTTAKEYSIIYGLIWLATIILIIIYVIERAINDQVYCNPKYFYASGCNGTVIPIPITMS